MKTIARLFKAFNKGWNDAAQNLYEPHTWYYEDEYESYDKGHNGFNLKSVSKFDMWKRSYGCYTDFRKSSEAYKTGWADSERGIYEPNAAYYPDEEEAYYLGFKDCLGMKPYVWEWEHEHKNVDENTAGHDNDHDGRVRQP